MNERLQLALAFASEASLEIAMAFAKRSHALSEKSANDFATETDASVEAHIAERIAAAFPGDVLIGEEGGERLPQPGHEASGYRWIVDPLDGTFNFVHGFPYIATSIAVERDGVIEIGVIANPLTDEVFYAERGHGAWLQHDSAAPVRLHVSACETLASALVASFGCQRFVRTRVACVDRRCAIGREHSSHRRCGA
jgi:myo-inositol-1(or 4)-monophosphatase